MMVNLIAPGAKHLITEGIKAIRHLCLMGTWDTTHGQHHWARAACMAEIIRLNTPGHNLEMIDVVVPALLHDLGRLDDSADAAHGVRGAQPAAKALFLLEKDGLVTLDTYSWGMCIHTVIHHCDELSTLYNPGLMVRDADILDLYRAGKDRVNTSRLTSIVALDLIDKAREFSGIEWEFNDGPDNT